MRYQKDHKIELLETVSEQDSIGAFHARYRSLGRYWAFYRPVMISAQNMTAGIHEIADATFTINKPSWFDDEEVLIDMLLIWHGRVLKVVRVEDIEGRTTGDVKLYVRQDPNLRPETIAGRMLPQG